MTDLVPTPGQTVGPFFHYALPFDGDSELVPPGAPGAVRLHGTCDRRRRRSGAGRAAGDLAGRTATAPWCSRPVRCAATAGPSPAGAARRPTPSGTTRSPRCARDRPSRAGAVLRRDRLRPRAAEPALHPRLPPRRARPWPATRCSRRSTPDRRATLVAAADEHGLVFDVGLQGERETVFLTYPANDDLLWPGDERAGDLCPTPPSSRRWSPSRTPGCGPGRRRHRARGRRRTTSPGSSDRRDVDEIAPPPRPAATRSSRWSPLLRQRLASSTTRRRTWLHRGLTSQDVVDTALVLCLREAADRVHAELARTGLCARAARRRAPVDGDGRPDPDPARRPDHLRPQGGRLAAGPPRRAEAARRRGRSAGAVRRSRRDPRRATDSPRRPACRRRPRRRPGRHRRRARPRRRPAVAHLTATGHPARRRLVPAPTRWGHIAGDVLVAGAAGDRRAGRARRRRPRWLVRRCRRSRTRSCPC